MILEESFLLRGEVLAPLPSLSNPLEHCAVFFLAKVFFILVVGIAWRAMRRVERVMLEEACEYRVERHLDPGLEVCGWDSRKTWIRGQ